MQETLGKYYVYAICDPRIETSDFLGYRPIYIGKGCGNRWQSHLKEAKGIKTVSINRRNSIKITVIQEIYASGLEPKIIFVSQNLDSSAAYDLEIELIKSYGRLGIDDNGILTNRIVDQRSIGGGRKGMKQTKPRSEEHRNKISAYRTGQTHSIKTRELFTRQRLGKKATEETKKKMSDARIGRGELWEIKKPDGEIFLETSLRNWCNENKLNYYKVWGNKDGFNVRRIKSDEFSCRIEGYVHIIDKNTEEVLVSKPNAIHQENMSISIAQSLADRGIGQIHEMVFGSGASTVSGTGAVTYFPPNVTGQTAQLYNQTYRKVVDDLSPLDVNTTDNNLRVQHVAGSTYSDIVITCTLEATEPSGQYVFDQDTQTESSFVFDELGLKGFAAIEGTGNLLSHVIFHPVQKSLNRVIEVVYTIRIFMA